jgi:hypothetical protein
MITDHYFFFQHCIIKNLLEIFQSYNCNYNNLVCSHRGEGFGFEVAVIVNVKGNNQQEKTLYTLT